MCGEKNIVFFFFFGPQALMNKCTVNWLEAISTYACIDTKPGLHMTVEVQQRMESHPIQIPMTCYRNFFKVRQYKESKTALPKDSWVLVITLEKHITTGTVKH